MPFITRKLKVRLSLFLITLLLGWMAVGYFSASYLTSSATVQNMSIQGEEVVLKSEDGIEIHASWMKGKSETAVVLLAGVKANRTSNYKRAAFYQQRGYSVLLPDLRGTGLSEQAPITFGWQERKDLLACLEFLKEKGVSKVAVHGSSLGAATILYSLPQFANYAFIVLESPYDRLDHAFYNRVQKIPLPESAYLPVHFFVSQKIGKPVSELNPIDFAPYCHVPVLHLAGDSEFQLKTAETKAVFGALASPQKELHLFQGGKHEDFLRRFEQEYMEVMNGFLNKLTTTDQHTSIP